jgi:hypothetical protein
VGSQRLMEAGNKLVAVLDRDPRRLAATPLANTTTLVLGPLTSGQFAQLEAPGL